MLKFAHDNAPILQLVAYVALTFSSIVVALLSATFAYRHNFGWKPLCLVTSHGLAGRGGDLHNFKALLGFEVWNRRKYPIIIRGVLLTFSNLEFEGLQHGRWHLRGRREISWMKDRSTDADIVLPPTSHHTFDVSVPFRLQGSVDDINDRIKIVTTYYDPRSGKHRKIIARYAFTTP